MFGLLVHMAAKDGDGMRTAVEALRWHVTFQPSVVLSMLAWLLRTRLDEGAKCWSDGNWPRERGTAEPTVWAMQDALHMLHLALERCLVTRGEEGTLLYKCAMACCGCGRGLEELRGASPKRGAPTSASSSDFSPSGPALLASLLFG
jgi:hypothetical protein